MLGVMIKHPNIIDYKYFSKENKGDQVSYHIIMELIEGISMSKYISEVNNNNPPQTIEEV